MTENRFNNYNKEVMKRFMEPKFMGEMKDADAEGEVGNMKCLLPNEKIFLDYKYEEIKNSNKSNKVFSHDGRLHRIKEKYSREFKGKVITIKNTLGNISLTHDHLVYAIKLPEHSKFFRTKKKKTLVPAWYHAEDLNKRDIILYPIDNEVNNINYIENNFKKSKWDFKSSRIQKKIELNNDFLRLSGYYLAEGSISEGKSRNYIVIEFNIKEREYINDVKKIVKKLFKIDVTIREEKKVNTTRIHIYSVNLARLFKKLFDKGAKNKKIPEDFMKLPITKQKSLLEGLWKGDGYINLNRTGQRGGYATISYQLAQQIKTLLLRQKIIPSIYVDKEKTIKGVNHKEVYRIHVGQKESLEKLCKILKIKYRHNSSYKTENSWFDKNYVYTPITSIIKSDYKGRVYNLEVDESHSYTTDSFCVHNCGDIMKIYLKIDDKSKKITDVSFQTFGCVAAIASSDALCEVIKGKTVEEAKKITNQDIVKELGDLPAVKLHCSVLGAGALKAAIANYEGKEFKEEEHDHHVCCER